MNATPKTATVPTGFAFTPHDEGDFECGLRNFFAYRDLGVQAATDGSTVAHVIRAADSDDEPGEWHRHDCDFQLVFLLKGWARFEYEGVGEVLLEPGACVHQPKGIRHRVIAVSADMELLEVVQPADFTTDTCEAP